MTLEPKILRTESTADSIKGETDAGSVPIPTIGAFLVSLKGIKVRNTDRESRKMSHIMKTQLEKYVIDSDGEGAEYRQQNKRGLLT